MKIKNWSLTFSAKLLDGGDYSIHFPQYGKEMSLDDVIEWFQNFETNVIIVEEEEEVE